MEIKVLEIRDRATFIPVICIRPVAENEAQRYLLRRDGYRADDSETCVIMIDAQCRGVSYDPYHWARDSRTKGNAHLYIEQHWSDLRDGDVIDVEFILGETSKKKISERFNDLKGDGYRSKFSLDAFADQTAARAACEAGYLTVADYVKLCERHGWAT